MHAGLACCMGLDTSSPISRGFCSVSLSRDGPGAPDLESQRMPWAESRVSPQKPSFSVLGVKDSPRSGSGRQTHREDLGGVELRLEQEVTCPPRPCSQPPHAVV